MIEVDASEEKGTAFKGFSMIVAQNPQAMEKVLKDYFIAIARYEDMNLQSPIKQELHEIFQNILNVYKGMIPQFGDFIGQLQPQDQQSLKQHYAL
jgi:transportin-1